MLKRLTFIVILLVFAKPVYDVATEYLDDVGVLSTIEVESVEQLETEQPSAELIVTDAQPETTVEIPKKIGSPEQLADAFYYYFSRFEESFTIEYKGSTADIENMLKKATEQGASRDTYIEGHLGARQIEYEYGKMHATINVSQEYLTNLEQERVVDAKIASIVAKVDSDNMTDFEKVKFANDYIVQHTAYSEDTVASAHSAYAIAQEGKAVCQGYALFALKLLRALDVEAMYVVGEVYTGGHAWNLVKVDGAWYHLDTTWNDPVPDRGKGVRYDYFLINDEDLRKDHTWVAEDYPQAKSDKYRYMHVVQDSYEKGEYIYFSHSDQNNKLYRLNKKTGEASLLADTRALFIVGHGDWLYFSNYSNGGYLSKIRLDGSEQSTLYREEVKNLFIEDNMLYFTAQDGIKKVEL